MIDTAKTRVRRETTERTTRQKPATIQDPAEPSAFPMRPKILFNLLLGTVAGLLLGGTFAFFLEYLDTSVKTTDEAQKVVGLPVLAVIPKEFHVSPLILEKTPTTDSSVTSVTNSH